MAFNGHLRFPLKVTPKASKNAIAGMAAGADGKTYVKVMVTAVPEDGKANAAVIKLLAKTWKIPKSSLTVVAGESSRYKTIEFSGDPALIEAQITALTVD